ncbi:MAG TPA: hypothetical protein VGD88_09815 [Opitutaceae bacterium]
MVDLERSAKMKPTSLAAFCFAGAALLFWRVGSAVVAEIGSHQRRFEEPSVVAFTFGMFALCALIPSAMIWTVFRFRAQPEQSGAARLAIAASVGFSFVTPALLNLFGVGSGTAPVFVPWVVLAFLSYRYLFHPAALRALNPHKNSVLAQLVGRSKS